MKQGMGCFVCLLLLLFSLQVPFTNSARLTSHSLLRTHQPSLAPQSPPPCESAESNLQKCLQLDPETRLGKEKCVKCFYQMGPSYVKQRQACVPFAIQECVSIEKFEQMTFSAKKEDFEVWANEAKFKQEADACKESADHSSCKAQDVCIPCFEEAGAVFLTSQPFCLDTQTQQLLNCVSREEYTKIVKMKFELSGIENEQQVVFMKQWLQEKLNLVKMGVLPSENKPPTVEFELNNTELTNPSIDSKLEKMVPMTEAEQAMNSGGYLTSDEKEAASKVPPCWLAVDAEACEMVDPSRKLCIACFAGARQEYLLEFPGCVDPFGGFRGCITKEEYDQGATQAAWKQVDQQLQEVATAAEALPPANPDQETPQPPATPQVQPEGPAQPAQAQPDTPAAPA